MVKKGTDVTGDVRKILRCLNLNYNSGVCILRGDENNLVSYYEGLTI